MKIGDFFMVLIYHAYFTTYFWGVLWGFKI